MADKIIVKPLTEIGSKQNITDLARSIELILINIHDTLKQIATELERIGKKVD